MLNKQMFYLRISNKNADQHCVAPHLIFLALTLAFCWICLKFFKVFTKEKVAKKLPFGLQICITDSLVNSAKWSFGILPNQKDVSCSESPETHSALKIFNVR